MEAAEEKEPDSREAIVRRRLSSSLNRIGAGLALILLLILAGNAAPVSATTLVNEYLVGPGGTGGTVTLGAALDDGLITGNYGGTQYAAIQTLIPYPGIVTQITVYFLGSGGTPSGTVTWNLYENAGGDFGSLADTGTFTPTASALNTINIVDGAFVLDNTYILEFIPTNTQSAGNFWLIAAETDNPYADGHGGYEGNIGTALQNKVYYNNWDVYATLTTASGSPPASLINDRLAQPFIISETITISGIKLDLKKGGTPDGILTLDLETDLGNMASGTLIDVDATGTINEADLTTDYALTEFTFADDVTLPPGKYWPVLSTDRTDPASWVAWAAAEFCPSDGMSMRIYNQDVWQPIQVVGLWEPVVVSVTLPATEEPNTSNYITLASGQVGRIDYTATGGETAIALMLFMILGLLAFLLIVQLTRRR